MGRCPVFVLPMSSPGLNPDPDPDLISNRLNCCRLITTPAQPR
jgi:hypothetical protein